ncbi:hypothetical protein NST63_20215 [Heyndrickxia sp. FSL W8-0496]|mgnify:CR=1 FL=1|uniref:hypothetical protein n=1 Tax=Heyndrickxia sp. FSL W8-0496 TaxID=2954702 RepID=UPI0030FA6986
MSKIDNLVIGQIDNLYLKGYSCTKIGKEISVNRKEVSLILKELGYTVKVIAGNHNKKEVERKYLIGEGLFKNGQSINKISKQLHISKKSFSNWLQKKGYIVKPKRGLSIKEKNTRDTKLKLAEELIKKGYSFNIAVMKSKADYYTLKEFLIEKGYELSFTGRKYILNEDILERIDTEEKAYWLGFLYADAYVSIGARNVLEITLKSDDLDQLVRLREFLGSDHPITHKEVKLNGIIYNAYRLAIYSKKLVNNLVKLGCIPKKSLVLDFPPISIVPSNLVKHFIRGYFDGDGTISFTKFKKHGFAYCYIGVISTEQFVEEIRKLLKFPKVKLTSEGNAFNLRYTGVNFPEIFLSFIYEDAKVYLSRKLEKFQLFITERKLFEERIKEEKQKRIQLLQQASELFVQGFSIRRIRYFESRQNIYIKLALLGWF